MDKDTMLKGKIMILIGLLTLRNKLDITTTTLGTFGPINQKISGYSVKIGGETSSF
jgi:hypothetical protein